MEAKRAESEIPTFFEYLRTYGRDASKSTTDVTTMTFENNNNGTYR
jgi:hypothetical protein